jgi:hypothetical protein
VPSVPFASLPDDARLWVFAAAEPVAGDAERALLDAADQFLAGWAAHGVPLRCARDWRDGRFLAIGVDQSVEGASGCSIDGLFRSLRALEPRLGTTLLAGGRVYWRDAEGAVRSADRARFRGLAQEGALGGDTPVFDTTATTVGAWRGAFERPLAASWHAQVVGLPAATADAGPRAGGAG